MKCIYTGKDESTDTFSSADHIFPKCIGGIHTLPKGWVCDSVNNDLSKLELSFGRQNPTVAISRMFLPKTGRRKHKNRNLIGIFENISDSDDYSLGYLSNGTPIPINQLCITAEVPIAEGAIVPLTVVVAPSGTVRQEIQIRSFWDKLCLFDGNVLAMKDDRLPANKFLLGNQDSRWFLGMSDCHNEESVKTSLHAFIMKMTAKETVDNLLNKGQFGKSEHQVHSKFSIHANIYDIMRVYGKIAVNTLARLKGHAFVMNESFNEIKHAILTGEHINDYVWIHKGPSTLKSVFAHFHGNNVLGEKFHSATLFQVDGVLYCEVALYGHENPYIVKMGNVAKNIFTDSYICDWENKVEYTLTDCILQICHHDETIPPK